MIVLFLITLVFLLIRLLIVVVNLLDEPYLPKKDLQIEERISILIPARNEEKRIIHLLDSIIKQNYRNIEVLVLDDNSTDNTRTVLEDYAARMPELKILDGEPLPEGWLGKNWACHQLAQKAEGDFLLFLDADVKVKQGFFHSLMHYAKKHRLSLLSVFTDQEMVTFGEKLLVPQMHYILVTLLPLRFIKKFDNSALSAASGQCMFFRASDYLPELWHEKAKECVAEDIMIMRKMKDAKYNTDARLSNGLISCRMYTSYKDALQGFSKNVIAGFGNEVTMVLYLIFTILIWIPLLFVLSPLLLAFCFAILLCMRTMISIVSRQSVLQNLILHPLQMLAFTHLAIYSLFKSIKKQNVWKGRSIDTQC
ncbi:MAG: glycosyltransferase [Cytophagaceae bacterium]